MVYSLVSPDIPALIPASAGEMTRPACLCKASVARHEPRHRHDQLDRIADRLSCLLGNDLGICKVSVHACWQLTVNFAGLSSSTAPILSLAIVSYPCRARVPGHD